MPLASIRKVTSTRGTQAGSGQIGILKRARLRVSLASSRSPWRTWMSTAVWLSTAVVKVSLTLVGMVVLRSTSRVKTPPMVSMPSESGTTSRRSMSRRRPERMPAWIPAPSATTRSGSMSVSGGRPKMASIWRRPGAHVGAAPLRLGLLGQHELGQALVEVVAPEVRVAARRQHLEHPGTEAQDGDVEGAAAQVVDRDHALVLLVEAVGERGRG